MHVFPLQSFKRQQETQVVEWIRVWNRDTRTRSCRFSRKFHIYVIQFVICVCHRADRTPAIHVSIVRAANFDFVSLIISLLSCLLYIIHILLVGGMRAIDFQDVGRSSLGGSPQINLITSTVSRIVKPLSVVLARARGEIRLLSLSTRQRLTLIMIVDPGQFGSSDVARVSYDFSRIKHRLGMTWYLHLPRVPPSFTIIINVKLNDIRINLIFFFFWEKNFSTFMSIFSTRIITEYTTAILYVLKKYLALKEQTCTQARHVYSELYICTRQRENCIPEASQISCLLVSWDNVFSLGEIFMLCHCNEAGWRS